MQPTDERKQKILVILKNNDAQSIKFAQTKQQLLDLGYSNTEIVDALYEFPYDGKPNQPATDNKLQTYMKNNPEAADKVARTLLSDLEKEDKEKAALNGAAAAAASQLHDYNAESYYNSRYFDSIGAIPYIYLVLCAALVMGIGFKLHRTDEAYLVLVISIVAYTGFATIRYFFKK